MQEAKSSIHIEKGNLSVVNHNDRSIYTVNSIFSDEKNEFDNSGNAAMWIYHYVLKKRLEIYTTRTGQKLNKRTHTHLSAIVNIKQNTDMENLNELAEYLENELGTAVFQIAIHRDEGHIKDGQNIKNYHAHIEMLGIDEQGRSIRRKLTKGMLSKLQDKTAEILNMKRGINYAKERKKRPRRLGTYEFKEYKRRENETVKNLTNTFSLQINDLKSKLKVKIREKKYVHNVMESILNKICPDVNVARHTYTQVQEIILKQYSDNELKYKGLNEQNKKYLQYLKNAKNMFLDLQKQKDLLAESLESVNDKLDLSEKKILFLENENRDLRSQISNHKQDDDEDLESSFRLGM